MCNFIASQNCFILQQTTSPWRDCDLEHIPFRVRLFRISTFSERCLITVYLQQVVKILIPTSSGCYLKVVWLSIWRQSINNVGTAKFHDLISHCSSHLSSYTCVDLTTVRVSPYGHHTISHHPMDWTSH